MDSPVVKSIKEAYRNGEEDEALKPLVAVDGQGRPVGRIREGDSVVFYDIRGEREVELTRSLTEKNFPHFPVKENLNIRMATMIEYHSSLNVKVAFPPEEVVQGTLPEVLSRASLGVLKVAESEKAVHIGYFMNGKREKPFPGEDRIIIPSPPGISSYTQKPQMSAAQVSREIAAQLKNPDYSLIIANLANVDVVGHSESKSAVLQAVQSVDKELGKIAEECRKEGITLVVTADHGTVEEWRYPDGTINTGHTKNPVPFILADFSSGEKERREIRKKGELSDVAPTILHLLGVESPFEMKGQSLLPDSFSEPCPKVLLLILDGWGLREASQGNLIKEGKTPSFEKLWSRFPHASLQASGEAVGMPVDTVGNSEAGHLHLGAGRRILLDRVKIDKAVQDGSFFSNPAFIWAMDSCPQNQKALHLLGIVSHYSSHGTIRHLFALLQMAQKRGVENVFIHSLIGRRGEKPESGANYISKIEKKCRELSLGQVVTVMGRYWALDREENWDRVKKAYQALVYGKGTPFKLGE